MPSAEYSLARGKVVLSQTAVGISQSDKKKNAWQSVRERKSGNKVTKMERIGSPPKRVLVPNIIYVSEMRGITI